MTLKIIIMIWILIRIILTSHDENSINYDNFNDYNNKNNANNNNNQNKETNKSIHNIKRKKCEFDVRTQTKPQTQPGKYTNTKLQSIATDMAQERCVIHLQ